MIYDTLMRLAEELREWPEAVAGPATEEEVRRAEQQVGRPFPPDYREFILRHGGGTIGALSVYGVRPASMMATTDTVVHRNERFQQSGWPGLKPVLVIASDGSGNPIGIGPEGRIWRSDHNASYVYQCVAEGFEEFIRSCLGAFQPDAEDLSTTYSRIAADQRRVLAAVGVQGRPVTPEYDNTWVEAPWDALDERYVVLTAVQPEPAPARPINAWRLTPRERPQPTPDDHYLDLTTLWRRRPALLTVLALPAGYRAYFEGDVLEAIFDPSGQQVRSG
jgi:hypothetical protein